MLEFLKSKRFLLVGLVVFLLGFSLASCGNTTGNAGLNSDDTGVTDGGDTDVMTDTTGTYTDTTGTYTGTTGVMTDTTGTDDGITGGMTDTTDSGTDTGVMTGTTGTDSGAMSGLVNNPGIEWGITNTDAFTLTGYLVGMPDMVSNTLTVDADGEEYTVYVTDTTTFEDGSMLGSDLLGSDTSDSDTDSDTSSSTSMSVLTISDLQDGDLVVIVGMRDSGGKMWAETIYVLNDMNGTNGSDDGSDTGSDGS